MNGLSWFIYFSNIVNTISNFAGFLSVVVGILFILFMVITSFVLADALSDNPNSKDAVAIRALRKNITHIAAPILLLCVPLALLVPDRQTMILMAGSEISERVIKSDAVQGVVNPGMDLIKGWIKSETDKLVKAQAPTKKD